MSYVIPWLWKEKSLDDFVDHDGETRFGELKEDRAYPAPDVEYLQGELKDLMYEALNRLPARERVIVERAFGLNGFREMGLRDIGEEVGLSHESVRDVRKRALGKIGDYISKQGYTRVE